VTQTISLNKKEAYKGWSWSTPKTYHGRGDWGAIPISEPRRDETFLPESCTSKQGRVNVGKEGGGAWRRGSRTVVWVEKKSTTPTTINVDLTNTRDSP